MYITFTYQPPPKKCNHDVFVIRSLVAEFKVKYILFLWVYSPIFLICIKVSVKDMNCLGNPTVHFAVFVHKKYNQFHIIFDLVTVQKAQNKTGPGFFFPPTELLGTPVHSLISFICGSTKTPT